MSGWRDKQAHNQARFREVNERTEQIAKDLGGDGQCHLVCECANLECTQEIELTAAEYERVRAHASRFAVALNHENPETESIVEQNERFAVVETFAGASSEIARETDPRSQQHIRTSQEAASAGTKSPSETDRGGQSSPASTPASPDPSAGPDSPRSWRGVLDAWAEPRLGRSVLDLATSAVPYLALLLAMTFALRVSVLLSLLLVVPASAFQVRTFIVFHDCTHGSFMRSRRANDMLGAVLGLLVWLPYRCWQHDHAVHHATAGDLDRRGTGDVPTLTVTEYRALPVRRRLAYRVVRNPLVMFGLGPFLVFVLKPRVVPRAARRRIRVSVLGTNLMLALIVAALCLTFGWQTYLLVQGPVVLVTGAVGIWLFYVQHQFEDTYWQTHADWRYDHAALAGSSYLKLPGLLRFFTGNIGFHHVHHLSVGIPNYNLQAAHQGTDRFQAVPQVTLKQGLRATKLKLWDEQRGRLVTFRQARA